jgi:Fic family protein
VADIDTRRQYLHQIVRNLGEQITTGKALEIYAVSPWPTVGKGAARRDLRDLARRGYLIPDNRAGARAYNLSNPPPLAHPFYGRSLRQELLKTIHREGGEWTAGRAKAACRRLQGTHVWRATARRLLAELHHRGQLERHGDGTPRRYYTYCPNGGAQ